MKNLHMVIAQEAGSSPARTYWNMGLMQSTVDSALLNLRVAKSVPSARCVAILRGSIEALEVVFM